MLSFIVQVTIEDANGDQRVVSTPRFTIEENRWPELVAQVGLCGADLATEFARKGSMAQLLKDHPPNS